jgi:hypothetical protein
VLAVDRLHCPTDLVVANRQVGHPESAPARLLLGDRKAFGRTDYLAHAGIAEQVGCTGAGSPARPYRVLRKASTHTSAFSAAARTIKYVASRCPLPKRPCSALAAQAGQALSNVRLTLELEDPEEENPFPTSSTCSTTSERLQGPESSDVRKLSRQSRRRRSRKSPARRPLHKRETPAETARRSSANTSCGKREHCLELLGQRGHWCDWRLARTYLRHQERWLT